MLIIFTTCKPFKGDIGWKQEQSIKSWVNLNIDKKIIIFGNDFGTKEICEKYNLIHESDIKTFNNNVPYIHDMFLIASNYANDNDTLIWTNADMIYYDSFVKTINAFKETNSEIKNFILVGQRFDWHNPCILTDLTEEYFKNNITYEHPTLTSKQYKEGDKFQGQLHAPTGIDYVVHSKTTIVNNIDKNLVIAGTGHDMIIVSSALRNNYYTCDITETNFVVHHNHGYVKDVVFQERIKHNRSIYNQHSLRGINNCIMKSIWDNQQIRFVRKK